MSVEKNASSDDTEMSSIKYRKVRDLVAYWILGLCNNFGYVVMLTAAHDILGEQKQQTQIAGDGNQRQCNQMSTGAILLADILPCLFIKLLCPFLPPHSTVRILVSCLFAIAGFLLVAFAPNTEIGILGVCSTSLASGLGESSLLAYSAHFHRDVISTWSSGTGGAGIFGSLAYATLSQLGFTPRQSMLLMISVPIVMFFTFMIILSKPIIQDREKEKQDLANNTLANSTTVLRDSYENNMKPKLAQLARTIKKMPTFYCYMCPLCFVYIFEYFINQGLFELVEYHDSILDHDAQYRWLNFTYQVGVFISRSSVNLFQIKQVWIMSILQFLNVILFLSEVLWFWVPSYWIVLAFTIFEGLLGGAAYVNTFYRISREVSSEDAELAMATVSLSDTVGISIAGFLSIPIHNAICQLPLPKRSA